MTSASLLLGALAWVECELTDAHEGGDHSIFVGRVVNAQCVAGEENTLVFYHRTYHRFASTGPRAVRSVRLQRR